MDASGIGSLASAMDKQTFGAAVVTKTLDTMNNTATSFYTPTDKQTFGAAVVSKTLDYMNSDSHKSSSSTSEMGQTYNFSKDVLGAYASGIGTLTNQSA